MAQAVKNPPAMQETQETQVHPWINKLYHPDYMRKRKLEQRKGGCASSG